MENPKSEQNQSFRSVPANDLDMQMQITDPAWQNLSPELKDRLLRKVTYKLENKILIKGGEELSGILATYTRDLRLGNLSVWSGEFEYVSYYVELAVDMLEGGCPGSAVISLNKALARLELSSSKGGFLRKLINTFRQESFMNKIEEPKKSIFGGGKNNKNSEGY